MATRTPELVRLTPAQNEAAAERARALVASLVAEPGRNTLAVVVREMVRALGADGVRGLIESGEEDIVTEERGGERELDEHDRMLAGMLLRVYEERASATRPRPIGFGDERYER